MILSYWSSRSKQPCYELPIEIDGSMAGHCCKPLGPVSDSANSQQNSKVLNHRAGKESACNSFFNARNLGLIPGLGRSPGEGKGNPLQYSGLENSMDYIVHGVAKSRTRLSNIHFSLLQSHSYKYMNSANKLNHLGSTFSPSQAFRWENSLADILITELCNWGARFYDCPLYPYPLGYTHLPLVNLTWI